MRQVYKCSFCDYCSEDIAEMALHEEKCGDNPQNKITDKFLLFTADVVSDFEYLMALAIKNLCSEEKINFILGEVDRASNSNCAYFIYNNSRKLDSIFRIALHKEKEIKWYTDHYPGITEAIQDVLSKPSWRETI